MKRVFSLLICLGGCLWAGLALGANTVPTDIQQPGTQPREVPVLVPAVERAPEPVWPESALNKACIDCHKPSDRPESIGANWAGSMMAQATRDPIFWATMAIAEQDFDGSGDLCLRCHTPRGWYDGRSTPTDGSAVLQIDGGGVECEYCHKLTNPDNSTMPAGVQNPPFEAYDPQTGEGYYGSGMAVLYGGMERLGPYDPKVLDADHAVMQSRFNRDVDMCGTCHDVSNPAVGDLAPNNGAMVPLDAGTFSGVLGGPVDGKAAFNNPPYKYGIVERTFSEYKAGKLSQTRVRDFATLPQELQAGAIRMAYDAAQLAGNGGDYADGTPRYFSCQTCHMSPVVGYGDDDLGARLTDFPLHDMTGGSYWMPEALKYLYGKGKLRLTGELESFQERAWDEGAARAKVQLRNAGGLSVEGNTLKVTNLTGHKLISGYPEGRRMWLDIKWYDNAGVLLREDGAYGPLVDEAGTPVMVQNPANGQMMQVESILDLHDPFTRIYEAQPGITQDWAAKLVAVNADLYGPLALGYDRYTGASVGSVGELAGTPEGTYKKTFHFVLNNVMTHDNRIPAYGMSYDEALQRNCLPVPNDQFGGAPGGIYNHWDELELSPPAGAVSAAIDLLYQSTSWEYIQFLYLANNRTLPFLSDEGEVMLEAWLNTGMSPPFAMASAIWSADGSEPPQPPPVGCEAPEAPQDLNVSRRGDDYIRLRWEEVSPAPTGGYVIFFEGGTTPIASIDSDTTRYKVTDLEPNTSYCFVVRAWNDCGSDGSDGSAESAASNVVCGTTR